MILTQLQQKIEKLESALHTDNKKRSRLGIIKHELDILRQELLRSNIKLKKEWADVEELEQKNIKSLFIHILGSIEEQLEKERQEYLQAVLHHNSVIDEIKTLEFEQGVLLEKILKDREAKEIELSDAIKSKETQLFNDLKFKEKLSGIDSRLKILGHKSKDIREAMKEGKMLNDNMEIVKNNLRKVKEWGAFKMHGRGRYSSYNKKNYIDKANRKAVIVNVYIKKFTKELNDVFPDMEVNLSIDYFENFLKHFYNNLITDWVIQRQLDNAIHGMTIMLDKLNRIEMLLEKEADLILKEKEELDIKRIDIIKSYQ